ncbi:MULTISPECIES: FecR family protein [Butyricimonas]|uniref:FecR family protein n=1 Tax=Butyricimonas TaxID=574697 RepID=UPI001D094D35|nr:MULTISPECIES: FecR domain-containing protein [Butyricimonas]MCB6971580.1 FecR domain-containing protein [Butyricimonas synergistica]MCG4518812.1 FecR domain-containing protein [Butyricimonas sp. DFI.6.44]
MKMVDDIFQDIQACWGGNATDEQVKRVREWMEAGVENRQEYERLSRLYYRLGYTRRWDEIDEQTERSRLMGRLSKLRMRRMGRYIWNGVAVACVVVGVTVFLWTRETTPIKLPSLNLAKVLSGSSKATLVLDDGRMIPLTADTSFRIQVAGAMVKEDLVAGLKYEISDSLREVLKRQPVGYNKLVVPRGGEYIMTLADGTRVWLNAETEMKYPVVFGKDTREVYVKGEAYFEVAKDTACPFIVYASGVATRVLGTSFNVMAYEGEERVEVTLVTGKVEVGNVDGKCSLASGWQAVVEQGTHRITRREVNVAAYTSWRNGLFDFREMTLEELVMKLSRWYDVDFVFENDDARDKRFTGAVKRNNTLEFMLHFIEKTSNVYFKVDKGIIRIYEK